MAKQWFSAFTFGLLGWFSFAAGLAASDDSGGLQHPYPLWPSEPVPGWPGLEVDEETTREKLSQKDAEGNVTVPAQYGQPEFLAYPGAVHHIRNEWQRYVASYPVYNQHTLVKNYILHEQAGYREAFAQYAEPVYYNPMYGTRVATSKKRAAVRVFPWKRGGTPIKLELGRLAASLYCIRPIYVAPGVADPDNKKYVTIQLRINDRRDDVNAMSTYYLRAQTLDNFYAGQEFFFHAVDSRVYRAELALMLESETDLLVYNVDLHDRFGQCARRKGKKRSTLFDTSERKARWGRIERDPQFRAEQLVANEEQTTRDDEIWRRVLPKNVHVTMGGTSKHKFLMCRAPDDWSENESVVRCKDGSFYGGSARGTWKWHIDNVQAKHTLPDSDKKYFDAAGKLAQEAIFPMGDWAKGELFYNATHMRDLPNGRDLERVPNGYRSISQHERDWAMRLVRDAYRWPALQPKHNLTYMIAGAVTGAAHRAHGLDREWNRRYGWGVRNQYLLEGYDQIFPVIDGNEEFARAVSRYIPWVKTPDDVIRLLDTCLVQDNGNDIMHHRYYYDHSMHLLLMKAVVVQDDPEITRPWMEFLWTRMWEYPQALSGMADNVVTGATRDGGTTIGSFNYTRLPRHMELIELVEKYLRGGGDREYNIADPDRYPQVYLSPYFVLEAAAAGRHAPGIGDVGGATQAYGGRLESGTRGLFASGWKWHHDPRFAYELVHTFGREKESNDEWTEIERTARHERDPYLQNRSRALADWSGYLEGGQDEDDFRFRRAAALRVGVGRGHNHHDTLDLRLWAHGIVMSGDAGQRSSYGRPNHRRSRVHNVLEVDGKDWYSHSWIANLFDAPGAHYMRAGSIAPFGMEHVTLFQRQVALLDAGQGRRSEADVPRDDPDVVTPSSYVLDLFRASGGKTYTYCFHGAVDDQFEVNVKNRRNLTGRGDDLDEQYMREFEYRKAVPNPDPNDVEWAADGDGDTLQATWRVARWARHDNNPEAKMYSGKHGGAMTAPRKYTRLHLLDAGDCRILHGICQDRVRWSEHNPGKPNYGVRCLFAQRRNPQPADTVFVGLIETYAGQPFISQRRLLPIEANDADARRAVAVEANTTGGHTDTVFADARPDRLRMLPGGIEIAAEYAFLSRDHEGLRHATINGGTRLATPELVVEPNTATHGGVVAAVDYTARRISVDGYVPAFLAGHFFEAGGDYHRTSYEVSAVESSGQKSVLRLRKGLEIMRTRLRRADPDSGAVIGAIAMIRVRGRDKGLVASNDELTKFWRVEYTGGNRHTGHLFRLTHLDSNADGPVFSKADFPAGSGLRVWEFGVGDQMLLRTGVALRRVQPRIYEVYATTPFRLSIKGRHIELGHDGKTWRRLPAQLDGGLATCHIAEEPIAAGNCRFFLRTIP